MPLDRHALPGQRSCLLRLGLCIALTALPACATIGAAVGGSTPDDPHRFRSALTYALPGYAVDGVIAGSTIREDNGYSTYETVGLVLIGIDALIATMLLVSYAAD